MMPPSLGHAADLAARASRAMPTVLAAVLRRRRRSLVAFDAAVLPLLNDAVADPQRHEVTRVMLRRSSLRGGHVMGGYCDLAAIPFCAELSVLGSCFAQLYEDLLTNAVHSGVAERLATLFDGGDITPAGDLESLLVMLYRAIEQRLARRRSDRVYRALMRMHRYRTRTCGVNQAWLSDTELYKLTIGKAGLGLVALLCLARSGMSRAENALVVELGAARQLVEDYQTREIDRHRGKSTLATRGRLHLSGILRLVGQLERRLAGHYGRRQARRFVDELYVNLFLSIIGRHRLGGLDADAAADRRWAMRGSQLAMPTAPLR